jgi:hypothetical protein
LLRDGPDEIKGGALPSMFTSQRVRLRSQTPVIAQRAA